MLVDHDARAGISQDRIFAEFRQRPPAMVRTGPSFFITSRILRDVGRVFGNCSLSSAAAMNAGGFGPAADEGVMRTDNYVMRRDDGVGHLIDDDILEPLPQELLHRFQSGSSLA